MMSQKLPLDNWQVAYDTLNSEQKLAVDAIDGPVMVIAGPGTGKTQILTLRIANILRKTDTAPESILALTFTEAGAVNMRERLRSFLGPVAYQIPIYTFHAFCEHLIASYPEYYERIVGGRLATDIERATLIETILDSGKFTCLRPTGNPILHIPTILSQISTLKREAVTPEVLRALIAEQEVTLENIEQFHLKGAHKGKVRGEYRELRQVIDRNHELLEVYRQYDALLRTDHRYDYDDMILETITALEVSEDMLLAVEEQYQYVLADEHQDVNGSQNRILELITSFHPSPNLFVVGDEKQAIYRFQGASLENFLHFEHTYNKTTLVSLIQNYRSPQPVLDLAHSLIAVTEGPLMALRVPLTAKSKDTSVPTLTTYGTTTKEEDALVEGIKRELKAGVSASEVAVIVRTNREVENFAERLRIAGIPVSASADRDVLTHPITNSVLALLEAVVYPTRTRAITTVLHGGYIGIERPDLVKLLSAQSYDRPLESILASPEILTELGLGNATSITQLMDVLHEVALGNGIIAPHRLLATLVAKSGLRDHVVKEEPFFGISLLRRLYDEGEAMVRRDGASTLKDLLDTFERYRRYNIGLSVAGAPAHQGEVRVLTAHKAKGLEFEVVFAPNLTDSVWGGKPRASYFTLPSIRHDDGVSGAGASDDDQRLFYVLMTRAKRALYLSHAKVNTDGKERPPSRLLALLDSAFLVSAEEPAESVFDPGGVITGKPLVEFPTASVAELFLKRGFSATSFNNYLKSPWTYIYQNLLRVPDAQSESLLFGTAIHSVLETVVAEYLRDRALPSTTELSARIGQALARLPISQTEFVRLHEKALTSLVVYLEEFKKNPPVRIESELKLTASMPTGSDIVPEVILSGKLDRLDFDEHGTLVRVLDYKTGKSKSRGDIAGTTKNSEGNYKRQLVFYALLLELSGQERLQCSTGTISFVQPNTHGEVKEETFVITNEEITELRQQISKAAEAIVLGTYVSIVCDPKKSSYCALVTLK